MDPNHAQRFLKSRFKAHALLGLLLSSFLTLVSACVPSRHTDELPTAKVTALSEEVSSCENQLRTKMSKKSIPLQSVSDWDSVVQSANALIPATNKVEYSLTLAKDQVQVVGLEHSFSTDKAHAEVSYSLSQAGKEAAAALYLDIVVTHQQEQSFLSIRQRMNVSGQCQLSVNETTLQKIKKIGAGQYTFSQEKFFAAEKEKDKFSVNFQVPDDQPVLQFLRQDEKFKNLPEIFFFYDRELGLIKVGAQKTSTLRMKEFDIPMLLSLSKLTFSSNDRVFRTTLVGGDETLGIHLSQSEAGNTWSVPKNLWAERKLSEFKDLNSTVVYELSEQYLKQNNSIVLLTDKTLNYEHIAGYWSIQDITPANVTEKLHHYRLTENSKALFFDSEKPEDLASNETIQTEIPEIQAIVQNILHQTANNRVLRVEAILKYLSENYPYDHKMVANNNVRPLSASEALARKTGVCQHFAVLFTTLARAMKIPTRIVVGYLLKEKSAGMHAWVEVEIQTGKTATQPGKWKVVEPQDLHSLSNMNTRNYIPLARGTALEDRNSPEALLNMVGAFKAGTFTIRER